MKALKLLFVLIAVLLASTGDTWASGRVYGSVGIYLGGPSPYWGPAYGRPYYYPRPYYPWPYAYPAPYNEPAPVVIVPAEPPVYIEQGDPVAGHEPDGGQYWYYCRNAKNYYPYVKECPGGWQKVPPQPAR